ncbi:MAG: cytochrome c biogenesis protein CcsA [Bacteroidia bacterium]|nr:cytochrome c biogenesis protein CcsA [Bacteroidia bacterium]
MQNESSSFLFSPTLRWTVRIGAIVLLTYALIGGLLFPVPDIGGNIQQTSRNLFYHVPMWFTMYLMMGFSVTFSLLYLKKQQEKLDIYASESAWVGVLFGLLGLTTGSVWSRVTWGELLPDTDFAAWWAWDPKQTLALTAVLIYLAYFVLRNAIEEPRNQARISAVYNIFAAASLVPLTLIIPRIVGGLHPGGSEGSPVFNQKDISNDFRLVFYPAILGFMCLALWIFDIRVRTRNIQSFLENQFHS